MSSPAEISHNNIWTVYEINKKVMSMTVLYYDRWTADIELYILV
jgi:hypothetical protein